ncbi:hypothetical protein [Flavobacterium aquidurense]|uniref:Lipoprotein n=1 Tax=Flavobacterium aquidurense TaxID=362413 RepID=A0A0Q0RMF3_9FLAO|nr:hypothetical protein [Flavobacterium aquidurense]KQB37102.1 hypothetical protein RC62_2268 [Flavobacterium aquidurense]
MITQKVYFKKYFIISIFFVFTSCMQNPEAKLQNERIKDLQDKNVYFLERLKEQEQKIDDLESKMAKFELYENKKIKPRYIFKSHKAINDTMYVRLVQNNK